MIIELDLIAHSFLSQPNEYTSPALLNDWFSMEVGRPQVLNVHIPVY